MSRSSPTDGNADWKPGDVVLSQSTGVVVEFTRYGFHNRPVWLQLSPFGGEVDGYDVPEPILLARWHGEKRLPVVDLEGLAGKAPKPQCHHVGGVNWYGQCIDCRERVGADLAAQDLAEPDGAA